MTASGAQTVTCSRAPPVPCRCGFAVDQHGRLRCQLADGAEYFLHRGAGEDVGCGFNFLRLADWLGSVPRAPDQIDRVIDVERLGQIFERAALKPETSALQVGIAVMMMAGICGCG